MERGSPQYPIRHSSSAAQTSESTVPSATDPGSLNWAPTRSPLSSLALLVAISLSSGEEGEADSGGVAGFEMDARENVEEDTPREGSSTWGGGTAGAEEPEGGANRRWGLAKPPRSSS